MQNKIPYNVVVNSPKQWQKSSAKKNDACAGKERDCIPPSWYLMEHIHAPQTCNKQRDLGQRKANSQPQRAQDSNRSTDVAHIPQQSCNEKWNIRNESSRLWMHASTNQATRYIPTTKEGLEARRNMSLGRSRLMMKYSTNNIGVMKKTPIPKETT
jgi:hypothetical protein